MKIVPTDRLEWPPAVQVRNRKYSPQVSLAPDGTLRATRPGCRFRWSMRTIRMRR